MRLQNLAVSTLEGCAWLSLLLGALLALSQMLEGTVSAAITAALYLLAAVTFWALGIVVALVARRTLR